MQTLPGQLIVSVLKSDSGKTLPRDKPTINSVNAAPLYENRAMITVNLKSDMPSVREALQRMERELALARRENVMLLKLIHGYGSTGAGGDIRIAVQKRLTEMAQRGQIRACIFGENWSKSDETTWKLLQSSSALKSDSDLGRRNRGITIVVL